jgi:hypothetical protein
MWSAREEFVDEWTNGSERLRSLGRAIEHGNEATVCVDQLVRVGSLRSEAARSWDGDVGRDESKGETDDVAHGTMRL